MMYMILSKLPKPLDLELLITQSISLFEQHPPETLPLHAWRNVSEYSVLKTTRDPIKLAHQTLEEGEYLYAKHAAQIDRQHTLQRLAARSRQLASKYQRPVGAFTLALAIGVLSLCIPSDSSSAVLLSARGKLWWAADRIWNIFRS
jgi:hypothetical protein